MSADISRFGSRSWATWAIALWLVAGVAAPATATPVTLFFNGPLGYGVSKTDALAFGFEEVDYIVDTPVILSVVDKEVRRNTVAPFPPLSASGNMVTSSWTVENDSLYDLLGSTYLLFVRTVPYEIGGQEVQYAGSDVGLSIDPELGWVLIHANAGPKEDYYYPAMSLGSLAPGERADDFDVNFVVDQPIQQVGNAFVLPRFQTSLGFTPIPEPGAGTLMGLGLVLLAALRRQRS